MLQERAELVLVFIEMLRLRSHNLDGRRFAVLLFV